MEVDGCGVTGVFDFVFGACIMCRGVADRLITSITAKIGDKT